MMEVTVARNMIRVGVQNRIVYCGIIWKTKYSTRVKVTQAVTSALRGKLGRGGFHPQGLAKMETQYRVQEFSSFRFLLPIRP